MWLGSPKVALAFMVGLLGCGRSPLDFGALEGGEDSGQLGADGGDPDGDTHGSTEQAPLLRVAVTSVAGESVSLQVPAKLEVVELIGGEVGSTPLLDLTLWEYVGEPNGGLFGPTVKSGPGWVTVEHRQHGLEAIDETDVLWRFEAEPSTPFAIELVTKLAEDAAPWPHFAQVYGDHMVAETDDVLVAFARDGTPTVLGDDLCELIPAGPDRVLWSDCVDPEPTLRVATFDDGVQVRDLGPASKVSGLVRVSGDHGAVAWTTGEASELNETWFFRFDGSTVAPQLIHSDWGSVESLSPSGDIAAMLAYNEFDPVTLLVETDTGAALRELPSHRSHGAWAADASLFGAYHWDLGGVQLASVAGTGSSTWHISGELVDLTVCGQGMLVQTSTEDPAGTWLRWIPLSEPLAPQQVTDQLRGEPQCSPDGLRVAWGETDGPLYVARVEERTLSMPELVEGDSRTFQWSSDSAYLVNQRCTPAGTDPNSLCVSSISAYSTRDGTITELFDGRAVSMRAL